MSSKKTLLGILTVVAVSFVWGCADKNINRARMTGSKYWTDKAYPGKAFDVQVTEATKTDDGKYRVKAMVDGETRIGIYNPETESFDEGYYSLAHERGKKNAEMDEEIRYLKDKVEKLEKENYQLKLRLKYAASGKGDPNSVVDPDSEGESADAPVKIKKAKAEKTE